MKEPEDNVMCTACREKLCRHARYKHKNIKFRHMLKHIKAINDKMEQLNREVDDLLMDDVNYWD
jgi:hypothetical protein